MTASETAGFLLGVYIGYHMITEFGGYVKSVIFPKEA